MYGAILGDMIGAPYEFDRGDKTKDFPLFSKDSVFTDDSVLTVAVAEALMDARIEGTEGDEAEVKRLLAHSMHFWADAYPNAGYGLGFLDWLSDPDMGPYCSCGNGSAMRVSSAGWLYDDLETTRKMARWTAEISHNHPEGIKGAEAIASAIFLARSGASKMVIKVYIEREFGYNLSRSCDEIRPSYYHVETCQQTVPEAITAFLEGKNFEDVICTAVSLGGDADTLTCIAGSIAEAYYGVPQKLKEECRKRLNEDMLTVIDQFWEIVAPNQIDELLKTTIRIFGALCPVCGKTLLEDSGKICIFCGWQHDSIKEKDPDFAYVPDELTLNQYKKEYESGWIPEHIKRLRKEYEARI